MTILTAVQEACPDLGIDRPLSIVSGLDATAVRLLDFAHDAGDDIARRGDWSRMLMFVTPIDFPFTLPDDFARFIPGSAINRTSPSYLALRGPLSSDQMAGITGGQFGVSARLYYGIESGQIKLNRALVAEAIDIRYVRKEWILNGTTYKTRATQNEDTLLFPDRLLTKAVIWRFRRETGLPYEDQMAEWEADIAMELRQDRGVTT
jgi:hypothetical protein